MHWILASLLHATTVLYALAQKTWMWIWFVDMPYRPQTQYFLSDTHEFDDTYTRVPEDAVYVEEWVYNTIKRCVVRYEGEEIPTTWARSPFHKRARCPWIWVGDRDTEIDLTRTFEKFLVVGNRITLDLVLKLIHVTERTNLIYVDRESFKELKFPGGGILIEEENDNRSRTLSDCGTVHRASEEVGGSVVGRDTSPSE